jgi:hypothetical protein
VDDYQPVHSAPTSPPDMPQQPLAGPASQLYWMPPLALPQQPRRDRRRLILIIGGVLLALIGLVVGSLSGLPAAAGTVSPATAKTRLL